MAANASVILVMREPVVEASPAEAMEDADLDFRTVPSPEVEAEADADEDVAADADAAEEGFFEMLLRTVRFATILRLAMPHAHE